MASAKTGPISYADLSPYYDGGEPIFRVSGRKEGLAQLPDGILFTHGKDSRQNVTLFNLFRLLA